MKRRLLREKAIFQIILLIIAVVYFSYAMKPVEAASDVCCEKTITDQYCFYGDTSNCDPAYQYAPISCEQTSYCKLGCCFDLDEGTCYNSVPQSKCLSAEGGEWYADETCESVGVCNQGCCVIGSQCDFITEQKCALETAKHPELEMVFYSGITTEYECADICRAGERGCCINPDKSCVFETREACDAASGDFHKGQHCSNLEICDCSNHYGKTCYDDDVYWIDSHGNLEDIAEDCDYSQGTICKKLQGEYICGGVDCEVTYSDERNVHDDRMGGFRKNGESWCVYESGTGDYKDRPGTRHYRHLCINGEEVVESCRDYREEVCTQGDTEGITGSTCIHNDIYESPIEEQVSTVPRGTRFWEDEGSCSEGNSDCTVTWLKKNRVSSWKCYSNCHCEEQKYLDDMAKACKTLGDCGADLNIVGDKTTEGLVLAKKSKGGPPTGEPSEGAWAEWSQYGVFGGMVDLFEKMMKFAEMEGKDAQKAAKKYKKYGQYAMYAGIAAGVAAYALISASSSVTILGAELAATSGALTALGTVVAVVLIVLVIVAIVLMILLGGSKTKEHHVVINCNPWQAPTGGKNCEECLDQAKVDQLGFYDTCTEYKCKSLGQNCEFIPENYGTERVSCFNAHPDDVNSPSIQPWSEALTEGFTVESVPGGYGISPKVPYYDKMEFGIQINELSQCKISQEHTENYDLMNSYFGDSFYQLEHKIKINPQVGGQAYEYYVRCRDGSGNSNTAEYIIKFTTHDEPDKNAPIIEHTLIDDYGYIPTGFEEIGFTVYVNEPADCKWSFADQSYDAMENLFYCEDEPTNALDYDSYACYTILNITEGLNTYHFRCQDKSEFKNQNLQSYVYHLTSTEPLEIVSQSPEGTIYGTVSPTLAVTTAAGAEAGKATCYFINDETIDVSLWPEFYETGETLHYQSLLNLEQGEHNYYVSCRDIAINEANTTVTFTIDKDVIPPEMEYIYIDTVALHVILDEPSTCEYSNETFTYGEGSIMSGAGTNHNTVSTESNYYYINCEDVFENHWDDPIVVYL